WSWNTSGVANGTHTLTLTAKDAAANSTSASISVTVNNPVADTTPPTVSFRSPESRAGDSGTISVTANVSDNAGVASVSFYVDGVLKSTVTASPYAYSCNTTTLANGSHTLMATAKDAAGNSASASISVTVNNPVADTTPPTVSF